MAANGHIFSTFARADTKFVRGEGVRLYAEDGTEFLDCMSGIAVNSLGHAHPHLVEALAGQASQLWHLSNVFEIPGQERLARRLCEASFADRVFFTNSGTEAIECAIKTARRYHFSLGAPQRNRIITFEGAFHGRTLAAIAAGGQEKYLEGFEPRVPGFRQLPFGDHEAVLAAVDDQTAAILVEPIQGEGGIRAASHQWLRQLRQLCTERGVLLIYDEVQCGIGRTGKFFAHEWAGAAPDILAVAKGLGGGFPVGACLATEAAASGMTLGTHGTTFGGNPLAMAVGNAVLDVVLGEGFLDHVSEMGKVLRQQLAEIADAFPRHVEAIRGDGLMQGIKMKTPNTDAVAAMRGERLLTVTAGENVIRVMPPLIVNADDLRDMRERMHRAYAKLPATTTQ
jgi:acetylornithine/N-succinyldiaminopimelate aminotransferase